MTSISSLQNDLDLWNEKSQTATDDAKKHIVNAANYNANGYADKAQMESNAAADKENKSSDYTAKAKEIAGMIESMEQEARQLESQINDLQDKLARITG